jgi:uncharacterized protein YecT (DUF1311 family)
MKNSKLFVSVLRAFIAAFVFVSLFEAPASLAAEGGKHPIDVELEKKIDADSSTAGMIKASRWAEGEWDKLLNKNYQALMKRLSKEEQTQLKASQREWIKFRDAEFDFNENFWGGFDGTMYRVFSPSFRSDFVRGRAIQLGSYLNDLNEK